MKTKSSLPSAALLALVSALVWPAPARGADAAPAASAPGGLATEGQLDIAPFGYVLRPDLPSDKSPSETQFLCTGDKKATRLGGVLWPERRPIQRVELRFPEGKTLDPHDIVLELFANSWWASEGFTTWNAKPPKPVPLPCTGSGSDKNTLVFEAHEPVLACQLNLRHKSTVANPPIPEIRVFSGSRLKKMPVEIEWGLAEGQNGQDNDGSISAYNGRIDAVRPLAGNSGVTMAGDRSWRAAPVGAERQGIVVDVSYVGNDAVEMTPGNPYYPNRTVVTIQTGHGGFSFAPKDLEAGGPIWAPGPGFFVTKAGALPKGREYARQWASQHGPTIRQIVRQREEQTLDHALEAYFGKDRPPIPAPGDEVKDKKTLQGVRLEPGMQFAIPDATLSAAFRLAYWHVKRRCLKKEADGSNFITDFYYPPIGFECATIIEAMDVMGCEEEITRTGFEPWFKDQGKVKRLSGLWKDVEGTLIRVKPYWPPWAAGETGNQQEEASTEGTYAMLYAMARHYELTGNKEWLVKRLPNLKAAGEWIIRQRHWWADRLGPNSWSYGLSPPSGTGDFDVLVDPFVGDVTQAWAYNGLKAAGEVIGEVDRETGARFLKEAEAHRQAIHAAVAKSVLLSPVVKVRDGAYRRCMPTSAYVHGLVSKSCNPLEFGGQMDARAGAEHLLWNVFPAEDRRFDELMDVIEDNFYLDANQPNDAWFSKPLIKNIGLPAQCYVAMAHLRKDDVPNFLRTTFNQYACEILPQPAEIFDDTAFPTYFRPVDPKRDAKTAYVFREGPTGGPDKIQETAAFVLRIRAMLVMEDADSLWLARGTPRRWFEQGKRIYVANAPTPFGAAAYEITSDVDHAKIVATVEVPSRRQPKNVLLRLRHPKALPIKSVTLDGKPWADFDAAREAIRLHDVKGTVRVEARY
jgi:hypothetical protein